MKLAGSDLAMSQHVIGLTDYQERFSSKVHAERPSGGMDKGLLKRAFADYGWELEFRGFSDAYAGVGCLRGVPIIYSSSEDVGLHYKSFIEDIAHGLELNGANVIPSYRFLRAHHNKVFMEILRETLLPFEISGITTRYFGTIEELYDSISTITFPCVIKGASGAGSRTVARAGNSRELLHIASRFTRSRHLCEEIRDSLRPLKYRGYRIQSLYRNKIIIQDYIPGLKNDWKILAFGQNMFVLRRENRRNDFRASGSGRFSFERVLPLGLLDFACKVFRLLNLPCVSMDAAFDGSRFYLLEFQGVSFGTLTLEDAPFHFSYTGDVWNLVEGRAVLEEEYARCIVEYISRKNL